MNQCFDLKNCSLSKWNQLKKNYSLLFISLMFIILCSCAGPRPILEQSLAYRAIEEAKKSKAHRLAPNLWRKSKQFYKKGMKSILEHKNKEAKEFFIQSRAFAEGAETKALITKSKSGEISW